MSKQDRQGVRTPADIERKYDLELLAGQGERSNEKLLQQINLLNQTLAQFMATTNGKIEELEKNSAVWFYSGVPTLENQPFVAWETDEVKAKHVGDFYYDTDNGSMYLLKATTDESTGEKVTTYELVNIINVVTTE